MGLYIHGSTDIYIYIVNLDMQIYTWGWFIHVSSRYEQLKAFQCTHTAQPCWSPGFFPFQFNAVEVQQKREKKATSLTLAKDAIVDMRLNEKTSNKTRRTRHQSKKDGNLEVSKVYLCKKRRRHKSRWERNLMICRYFGGGNPYRNSQREDFIPFNVTQPGPCISSLFNLGENLPRFGLSSILHLSEQGVGHVNKLLLLHSSLIGVHSCLQAWWNHKVTSCFFSYKQNLSSSWLSPLLTVHKNRSLSWNHEPNDSRARVANSKDSAAMEGNRS